MVAASKGCFDGWVRHPRTFGCGAALLAGFGFGCGPSFQAIYEGNAQFEHCYALEERPQVAMQEKASCWQDWSSRYTYGQTRDRIHYATARYVALSQTGSVPTDEALMMAAPGMTPRTSIITAPAPTSALAPPPKVLADVPKTGAPSAAPKEVPSASVLSATSALQAAPPPSTDKEPPLPASECTSGCASQFRACNAKDCDAKYRACMRACMK